MRRITLGGGRYLPGGLDQLVSCAVACPRCRTSARRFLPVREALRVAKGDEFCPRCRGALSLREVEK